MSTPSGAILGAMVDANPLRCAVLGAGSFGTCLAIQLAEKDYAVDLWARDPVVVEAITRHRRNPRYLTDFQLPENIRATADLSEAIAGKDLVLSVVPSHATREVWTRGREFLRPDALLISASKGIEVGSGLLVSQILEEVLDPIHHERLVSLSGPSFAGEIAERKPTAVTLACRNEGFGIAAQSLISSPLFRCYTNPDVIGVELGGALKNVVAIAVGAVDGMGIGLNARATVITRGLAEIMRLGAVLGANPLTFLGLSGMGDLVLTATGDLSRNRTVGLRIGRGEAVADVLGGLTQVAEGVRTTQSAYELAERHHVDMPFTRAIYRVLYEGQDYRRAVLEVMGRQLKSELD
jgi:glycerol-3-phosphate dehydrogenase (NAD(P)+)